MKNLKKDLYVATREDVPVLYSNYRISTLRLALGGIADELFRGSEIHNLHGWKLS